MNPSKIVPLLLEWFKRHARDLPWRQTSDPYAIWVSEIMLQQTQVKTVIPYWERWMQALPNVGSLARATPSNIHKLWEGLGYYTRVRNMQKAAQVLVKKHGSRFPTRFEDVLELPGIGRYTAGAICSIAFNQPRPILDGNVTRVLSRAFGIEGNPRDKAVNATLWGLAERLVQETDRPWLGQIANARPLCSHLNQSLMELGALMCTPREPRCGECPLVKLCVACKQGRVEELPHPVPRPQTTRRRFVAFVLRRGADVLLCQRPAGVVNAHLWEFPNVEVANSHRDPRKAALKVLGMRAAELRPLCTIHHSITRYRIRLDAFEISSNSPRKPRTTRGQWLQLSQIPKLAFASAHKKILLLIDGHSRP